MTQFFRLLFIRLVMNLADSVFYITVLWYVNNHYSSSFFLGIFMALIALPDLLLIFWGPLIDRINPKKVLLMSIIVQMFSIMLLLILKNDLNFLLLSVLVFISIMASSVSYVIEDVLIPQIVDYNKIVLASSVFSLSYKALDAIFNALT
ncbi:MAG: MFS transporter, partial [Streptococcus gallolyticus]